MSQKNDSHFRFRQARQSDINEINEIALRSKAYWNYSAHLLRIFEPELRRTAVELNSHNSYTGLALDPTVVDQTSTSSETICGFFIVKRISGSTEGDLDALFIDPDYIRQGLGSRLLQQACEIARSWQLECLKVESDPNAEPFYIAMGAVRIGNEPSKSVPGRTLPLLRLSIGAPNASFERQQLKIQSD